MGLVLKRQNIDTVIQRVKRQYKDPRAQRNLEKLNEELTDVTRIMTQNIQDVLGRGEVLDRKKRRPSVTGIVGRASEPPGSGIETEMRTTSGKLVQDSKKYLKDTKKLNLLALYHKYGPPVAAILVVLFFLYIRYYWF